jgi:hypothetical protein
MPSRTLFWTLGLSLGLLSAHCAVPGYEKLDESPYATGGGGGSTGGATSGGTAGTGAEAGAAGGGMGGMGGTTGGTGAVAGAAGVAAGGTATGGVGGSTGGTGGLPGGAGGSCSGTLCESDCVDVSTDLDDCGACGRPCSMGQVDVPSCRAGRCDSTCVAGWGNCYQSAAPASDNGCETNLNGDVNHCGACGRACRVDGNVDAVSCAGGRCTSTCLGGWGNLSRPAAPESDDGCETDLNTDPNNCGSAGNACAATYSCVGGECSCPDRCNLIGAWHGVSPAPISGAPEGITGDYLNPTFVNEGGGQTGATWVDCVTLSIPAWGGVHVTVLPGCREIDFSDGSIWAR